MGKMEMKCILYFYMDQGYSGEWCGPGPLVLTDFECIAGYAKPPTGSRKKVKGYKTKIIEDKVIYKISFEKFYPMKRTFRKTYCFKGHNSEKSWSSVTKLKHGL
jgi:hypothetical protein